MKTSPKTHFFFKFKNSLHSGERLSFTCTDEKESLRKRSMNVMHHTVANALEGMLSYFHCFTVLCGRAKTIPIHYVWTRIFRKWRRNSFSKISRNVWTRLQVYSLKAWRLSCLTYLHGSLGKILYQYQTNIRNRIHNIIWEKGTTGVSEEKIFTTDLPI